VVGFASGGIPDMVRPGETGWLAPTGDTQALREAIEDALRDDERRAAMSPICRRIAIEEYSLDVQATAYARLYETLVARVGNPAKRQADSGTQMQTNVPNARSVVPIKL
jgi:glycosyltransferase involved in cell wall biosynthesis